MAIGSESNKATRIRIAAEAARSPRFNRTPFGLARKLQTSERAVVLALGKLAKIGMVTLSYQGKPPRINSMNFWTHPLFDVVSAIEADNTDDAIEHLEEALRKLRRHKEKNNG